MDVNQIADWLALALQWAVTIVGAASLIVAAAEKIAGITPTTKDDLYVGKVKAVISSLVAILDRLALNPDQAKARKAKDADS